MWASPKSLLVQSLDFIPPSTAIFVSEVSALQAFVPGLKLVAHPIKRPHLVYRCTDQAAAATKLPSAHLYSSASTW